MKPAIRRNGWMAKEWTMQENDPIMVNIFVSAFRVLKEKPPPDAIEVQLLSQETESGSKDLLQMYQNVKGEAVPARLYAKFWSAPDPDESLRNQGT